MSDPKRSWSDIALESATLAIGSIRAQPVRSALAIVGVVIGIVSVVLVTAVLAGLRNQVALLFREFGTDNIFAFHLTGDPYSPPSEAEAQRKPLDPAWAADLERLGADIRDVGVQVLVPSVIDGRALVARGGGNESDTVLVEGISSNFLDITNGELAGGRPFTELEDRAAVRVAIVGANISQALWGRGRAVGKTLTLGGSAFTVVGEAAPRKGAFFGENRQDNVVAIPAGTARRFFPDAKNVVLYIRAEPGRLDPARTESEAVLRRLRNLGPAQANDFNLSTADQIIAQFDRLSAAIGLVTVALAGMSLLIGGIGIANVMIIAVTERTREIGVRRAVGARRSEVLQQFLMESAILSGTGGALGTLIAGSIGFLLSLVAPTFPAVPPLSVVIAGLAVSCLTGIVAGYGPARRAAGLDPVEALRYE